MIDPTAGTGPDPVPAVDLSGVSKRFGSIVACDDVDIKLWRGRIHGILGENGAGKSTLMKILIGLVPLDAGQVSIDGVPVAIRDPADAARYGIGMVHQHLSLIGALTVWENVMLGDAGRFDATAARRKVAEISEHYGLGVDADARVADLPAGVRQRVEIIKCLRRDPDIIIFDEPTSILTPAESERLFEVLRRAVRDENRAVALVSHKLDEVLRATDEVTIMRSGSVVERMATADADAPRLARAMVGRDVSLRSEAAALGLVENVIKTHEDDTIDDHQAEAAVLVLRDVVVGSSAGPPSLDGLSLTVRAGEIVGVAGVEGNGQAALVEVLSSLVAIDSGSIEVDGVMVSAGGAGTMARAGVAIIPADRHDSGCVMEMSVTDNLFLVDLPKLAKRGFYDPKIMRRLSEELIDEFEIQTSGPDAPFWSLSGGNQQRVVLAREMSHDPKVLVASQPSRGLDVGAIEYISNKLRDGAAAGVGVLLISSELEEILDLADRIIVLFRGRVAGEMKRSDVDLERLGLLMGGAAEPQGEAAE